MELIAATRTRGRACSCAKSSRPNYAGDYHPGGGVAQGVRKVTLRMVAAQTPGPPSTARGVSGGMGGHFAHLSQPLEAQFLKQSL